MSLMLLVVSLIVIAAWVFLRSGRRDFWKVAASHPDEAYKWFVAEESWTIVDSAAGKSRPPEPTAEFVGPFPLWVPQLGRRISVYARAGNIEDSQNAFRAAKGLTPVATRKPATFSILGVAYPILVTVYYWRVARGEPFVSHLGWGISQLGYSLIIAGIFAGTFLIFQLSKRWQVLASGVAVLLLGTVLSNLK